MEMDRLIKRGVAKHGCSRIAAFSDVVLDADSSHPPSDGARSVLPADAFADALFGVAPEFNASQLKRCAIVLFCR